MRKMGLVFLILMLSGCAGTASRLNKISLGMTKNDVLRTLGSPVSTSAIEGTEYLNYRMTEKGSNWALPYFVRFRDGLVDAYGRLGDFDSTKKSSVDVNINK